MSALVCKCVADIETHPETLEMAITVSASSDKVWQALTDPESTAQWFGSLDAPLAKGERVRLDFNDGDFFILENIRIRPPDSLHYDWRFLGIGPLDSIAWNVFPQDIGCLVKVTDEEKGRSVEEALELREGWLDFMRRLEEFLFRRRAKDLIEQEIGKSFPLQVSSRYELRNSFDGFIELAGSPQSVWTTLFGNDGESRWLPLDEPSLKDGTNLILNDGQGTSRFKAIEVDRTSLSGLRFQLAYSEWPEVMNCQLRLSPRSGVTLLTVQQTNWNSPGMDIDKRRRERQRFSAFWIAALRRARHLVENYVR